MIKDHHAQAGPQWGLLALQGTGLVLLAVLLIQLFSGGKGPLLLVAILAVVSTITLLQRPHWGVLIIVATSFIGVLPIPFEVRYLKVKYLVGVLLLIPLALSVIRDRGIWVWRVPQVKIFVAIGTLFVVSTWWSHFKYPVTLLPELDQTAAMMRSFFSRLGFLIFFLYFIRTRQRIELTVWLILGLIGVAVMSAALFVAETGGGERAVAAFSLADNENRLAYISLFGTSLLWFYRSYGQSRMLKALTLPFLFLLPMTALATGSRSGFLLLVILAALVLKEREGWSAAKRVRSLFFAGSIALVLLVAVPTAQLMRATTFDRSEGAPGAESIQNRLKRTQVLIEVAASDPIFGIGIGNFVWMHQAFYGSDKSHHNSYFWALTSGGIGALALYLLLFYVTYRMLRQLERAGPRELLWLSKGLKVNLILFLVFSAFANFWLNKVCYFIIQLTIAMYYYWQRNERLSWNEGSSVISRS